MEQTTIMDKFKTGIFIKELKNRFLCEVEIESELVVCYVPLSCHLSNFLNLSGKEVLLVPTANPHSRTEYALYAVPYKKNYIVLNTSMANHAVEVNIHRRLFSYLGKRKTIIKEHTVFDYKCDLYIADTDTIIEIKSIISTKSTATFPTVYSERTINQLRALQVLLRKGKNVCLYIVSLHPYVKRVAIDGTTKFYDELERCINAGLILKAYTSRLTEKGLQIEYQIPIVSI